MFIEKQTSTLRLSGCPETAMWVKQGEKDEDDDFRQAHHVGPLRLPAPNAYNYIQKYTCYKKTDKGKCSHTFYVFMKPQAELPLGLQVAEGTDSGEWEFSCNFPYCRLRKCEIMGSKDKYYHRRVYPPYTIEWRVPETLRKKLGVAGETIKKGTANGAGVEFKWETLIRKYKDGTVDEASEYAKVTADDMEIYLDGFGEKTSLGSEHAFHSRIVVKNAKVDPHDGEYECIITDANGVDSRQTMTHKDFRGTANIHVMPAWQRWVPFAVAGGCIFLVTMIILICPRKMEYDDGTPYTKEELVSPADTASMKNDQQ